MRYLSLLVLAASSVVAAQTPSPEPPESLPTSKTAAAESPKIPEKPDSNRELLQLVIQDQWDRGVDMFRGREIKPPDMHGKSVAERDQEREAAVRKLLADGSVKSGSDFQFAALIFQHSATAEGILLAHILATTAVGKGNPDGRWLAAASLDRYLWKTNQPQVFGTQFKYDSSGKWSMEPYARGTLSDAERALWCVVPLKEQEKILADVQQGQPLGSSGIIDCK